MPSTHLGLRADTGYELPGLPEPLRKEQWRTFVNQSAPQRPELPATIRSYRALSEEAREDLIERRIDHHSALTIVETNDYTAIHDAIRTKIDANRRIVGARQGIVVDAAPTLGKSTTVKNFGRKLERARRRKYPERFEPELEYDYLPVVYISCPEGVTPLGLTFALAHYLGHPIRSRDTKTNLTIPILDSLIACGTELVIIDDIHNIDGGAKDGRAAINHLKHICNHCPATFVLTGAGVDKAALFDEGTGSLTTQMSGRFASHQLQEFGQKILKGADPDDVPHERDTFRRVLKTLEDVIDLYKHPQGLLVDDLWLYMLDRTSGNLGSLTALIRESSILAIREGGERIDKTVMDRIRLDRRAELRFRERHRAAGGRGLSS